MGLASYEVVGRGSEWTIRHDGHDEHIFQTKESAFNAAVEAASMALRQGHAVVVSVPETGAAISSANPTGRAPA